MTGRKMPPIPHALLDIFSDYDLWLCSFGARLNEAWSAFLETPAAAQYLSAALEAEAKVAPGDITLGDWLVRTGR